MKRSKALKELIKTAGAYDSWKEQCDYMLRTLEDIGMEPPFVEKIIKYDPPKNFISHDGEISLIEVCDASGYFWEPEDEKK